MFDYYENEHTKEVVHLTDDEMKDENCSIISLFGTLDDKLMSRNDINWEILIKKTHLPISQLTVPYLMRRLGWCKKDILRDTNQEIRNYIRNGEMTKLCKRFLIDIKLIGFKTILFKNLWSDGKTNREMKFYNGVKVLTYNTYDSIGEPLISKKYDLNGVLI